MSYLLIIHIGPVQDFIASARRSRDLWFGSWLLSELSKAAANSIVQQEGKLTNLIFPAIETDDDLKPNSSFDVANKIVAIIENHPTAIAKKVLSDIEQRLDQIKGLAFKNFTKIVGPFDSDVANLQIKDMLETFWVAKKLDKDYSQVRKETEALMTARKATNNYKKVSWGSSAAKSSLDGQRESVIDKIAYKETGEHLCGVGLLKRYGQQEADKKPSFFSTSHVASLPFLSLFTQAAEAIAKPAFKKYISTLKELGVTEELGNVPGDPHPIFKNCDGELLYEDRLNGFFAKNETDKINLNKAKEALRKFYQDCEPIIDNKKPSTYYGLLLADGDAMGKAIAQQKTVEGHQKISEKLRLFAKSVRQIVKENNGSLVYAGGDDVLAFLPLHTILKCAQQLAKDFCEKLQECSDGNTPSPTLSVGIAIVHHLDPLSDALALVRKAEKAAKSLVNKKALAITVSKRSGIDTTVKGHWDALDNRLCYWTKLLYDKQLPHGVAYELRNLALRFSSKDPREQESFIPILQIEAARILARKRAKYGQEAIDKKVVTYVKELLGYPDKKQTVTVEDLANEIIVARVFADALKLTSPISNKEDKL